MCINIYLSHSESTFVVCVYVVKNCLICIELIPGRSWFSFSQQSKVAFKFLGRNVMPWIRFPPSILAYLLTLPLFRSHLCNHFYERLFHSRLAGILDLTLLLTLLLRCSLSHRYRNGDVNHQYWYIYTAWSVSSTLCTVVVCGIHFLESDASLMRSGSYIDLEYN